MPDHRTHRRIDKAFLGKEYPDVHKWMDEPYKWLGPRHRILRHDPFSILLKYRNDPNRLTAALLHLLADKGISALKRSKRKKRRKKHKTR